jgi:hypothetical protein
LGFKFTILAKESRDFSARIARNRNIWGKRGIVGVIETAVYESNRRNNQTRGMLLQ